MSKELAIQALIKVANAEVGYLEKASNSQLDSKTANAGSANYTKYARDLDDITGFYNFPKQGHEWCAMFHDWCMVKAYGVSLASKIMYHNQYSAGTVESSNAYKSMSAWYLKPQIGDQIFFRNSKGICHTGIVSGVDTSKVYTIEGNTGDGNDVIPNGGKVCKKWYYLNYAGIAGYGRPNYDLVSGDFMTDDEVYQAFMRAANKKATSSWSEEASKEAIQKGYFKDANGDGLVDDPQAPVTREALALILKRVLDENNKA